MQKRLDCPFWFTQNFGYLFKILAGKKTQRNYLLVFERKLADLLPASQKFLMTGQFFLRRNYFSFQFVRRYRLKSLTLTQILQGSRFVGFFTKIAG